jgi:hypothetical protein
MVNAKLYQIVRRLRARGLAASAPTAGGPASCLWSFTPSGLVTSTSAGVAGVPAACYSVTGVPVW